MFMSFEMTAEWAVHRFITQWMRVVVILPHTCLIHNRKNKFAPQSHQSQCQSHDSIIGRCNIDGQSRSG